MIDVVPMKAMIVFEMSNLEKSFIVTVTCAKEIKFSPVSTSLFVRLLRRGFSSDFHETL